MKILETQIFNTVNHILKLIQAKTDKLRKNSFFLTNIDFFIFYSIIAVYVLSIFAPNEITGLVSILVPFFIFIKVLITKNEKIELEFCNFFLLIYLLICLISNFTSSMPLQSMYGFSKTLIYFAFYFALCQFLKNQKKYIIKLLFIIASLVSIESIIGLMQHSVGIENISTWQDTSYLNPEDIIARVYGTLKPYNPNLFGGYLIAGFPAIVAMLLINLKNKKTLQTIISFCCCLVCIFTIFLTGCRGAYLALFTAIAGFIIASFLIVFHDLNLPKLKFIWKTTFFAGLAGIIIFLIFNHGILQRLMSIFILRDDSSTSFRINVYNSAIQMLNDNWLFGIGVGNKVFREIYGLYMLSGFDALSCYSTILEMAVESGVFAALAYLLFLFTIIFNSIKIFLNCSIYFPVKKEDKNPAKQINQNKFTYKILLFIPLISIISVMIHGIFDTIYFRPQIQFIFWTMAAILTILIREKPVKQNENS